MGYSFQGGTGILPIKEDVQNSVAAFERAAQSWGEKADAAFHERPEDNPGQGDIAPYTVLPPINWSFQSIGEAPTLDPATLSYTDPRAIAAYAPGTIEALHLPTFTAPDPITFDFDLEASRPPLDVTLATGQAPDIVVPDAGERPVFTVPEEVTLTGVVAADWVDPGIGVDPLALPAHAATDPSLPTLNAEQIDTLPVVGELSVDLPRIVAPVPEAPNDEATLPGDPQVVLPSVSTGPSGWEDYAPTPTALSPQVVVALADAGDYSVVLPTISVSLTPLQDPTAIDLAALTITPGDFTLTAPTITLPSVSNQFDYRETPYSPLILTTVTGEIRAILGGRQAIPDWVWSGIWSKTTGDLERVKQATYREADREHASRGWALPGGAMLARRAAAKQQFLDAATKTRWEQTILQAQQIREDFFAAMTQGLACEQVLLQADHQSKERLLRAAVESNNASYAALQAAVQAYSAQVQWAQTEVQQRRLAFDAQMADLEVFKANIERLRLYQASDTWNLERYKTEMDGLRTVLQRAQTEVQTKELRLRATTEVYRANLEAARTNHEGDKLRLDESTAQWEAARLALQDADQRVKSKDLELRAALGHLDLYRARVEAAKLGLEQRGQNIQLYQAQWEGVKTDLQRAGIEVQAKELLLKAVSEANNTEIARVRANHEVDATAVQFYAAQWDGVTAEIQAAGLALQEQELKLKAALGKVDAYRAQLDRAKLFLEHDDQLVKRYSAQWAQVDAEAKAYAAWVDNVKNGVDAQRVAVEAYSEEVKAQNLALAKYSARWDAYGKQVDAARTRVSAYEAGTGLFAQQVAKYQAQTQAASARVQADIDLEKLKAQSASLDLERFKTEWSGIQTKLQALTQVFTTEGQVYAAKGQVEVGRLNALTQQHLSDIEKCKMDLQGKIETARNRMTYWQSELAAVSEWQKARAQVFATLGGAAYTAANISMGASVGFDYNQSESVQTSYSYQMEG